MHLSSFQGALHGDPGRGIGILREMRTLKEIGVGLSQGHCQRVGIFDGSTPIVKWRSASAAL